MVKSIPIYDTLYVGSMLQERLEDFSNYEIQLFCYLACLLSLYDGKPISVWGYSFIKNEYGSPYSRELEESIDALVTKDSLKGNEDGFISLNDVGFKELSVYSNFPTNKERHKYLQAACQSIQLLSYGVVKDSLSNEPLLRFANLHSKKRLLTDEEGPAFSVLYDQFDRLKSALADRYKNLLIPATVWLEYLASSPQNEIVTQ